MAEKDVEINIKINSNDGSKIKELNNSFKEVEAQGSRVGRAFSFANSSINSLSGGINAGVKSIKSYGDSFGHLYKNINSGINLLGSFNPTIRAGGLIMREVGETFNTALIPVKGYLNTAEKASGIVKGLTGLFIDHKSTVETNSESMGIFGSSIENTNQQLSQTSSLIPQLVAHLTSMFAASKALESSEKFNYNMRQINSIAQMSEETFSKTSESVMRLADSLKLADANSLSEGMADLVSSNYSVAESFNILEKSTKAAKANFTDTKTMTEATSTVLLSFNKDVSETDNVLNVLTKTLQVGKGTMGELNSALGTGISLSKTVNQTFEEAAAVMAVLSTRGETNNTAATKHTQILQSAVKPTELSIKSQEKLAAKLGLTGNFWDINTIKSLGFSKALSQLIKNTEGYDQDLANILGTTEALVGVQKLAVDGLKAYDFALNETSNANNTYERSLLQYKKTWQSTLEALNAVFTNLKITFGTVIEEAVTPLLEGITWAIENFNNLDESTKKTIARIIIFGSVMISALATLKLLIFQIGVAKVATLAWQTSVALLGGTTTATTISLGALMAAVAPFLAVAGIFYGIDVAVNAWKDSSSGLLRFLSEILDKINLIKLARVGLDTWQLNSDLAKQEEEDKNKFTKAQQTVKELLSKEVKTAEELNKLADALIVYADNSSTNEGRRYNIKRASEYRSEAKKLSSKIDDAENASVIDPALIEKDAQSAQKILDDFNRATMEKYAYKEKVLKEAAAESIKNRRAEMIAAGKSEKEINEEISRINITLLNDLSKVRTERAKEIKDQTDKNLEALKRNREEIIKFNKEKKDIYKDSEEFIRKIQFDTQSITEDQKAKASLDLKRDLENLYKSYEKTKEALSSLVNKDGQKAFSPSQIKAFSDQFSKAYKEYEAKRSNEIGKINYTEPLKKQIEEAQDLLEDNLDNEKLTAKERLEIERLHYEKVLLMVQEAQKEKSNMTKSDFEHLEKLESEYRKNIRKLAKNQLKEEAQEAKEKEKLLKDTTKEFTNFIGNALEGIFPGINKIFDLIFDKNTQLQDALSDTLASFFDIGTKDMIAQGTGGGGNPKGSQGFSKEILNMANSKEGFDKIKAFQAELGATKQEIKAVTESEGDIGKKITENMGKSTEAVKDFSLEMGVAGMVAQGALGGVSQAIEETVKALSGQIKTQDDVIESGKRMTESMGIIGWFPGLIQDLIDIPRQAEKARIAAENSIRRLRANLANDKNLLFRADLADIEAGGGSPEEKQLQALGRLKQRMQEINADAIDNWKSQNAMLKDRRKQIEQNRAALLAEAVGVEDVAKKERQKAEAEYQYQQDIFAYNQEIRSLEIELTNDRIKQNQMWYDQQKATIEKQVGNETEKNLKLKKLDQELYQKRKDYEIELARAKAENEAFNQDKATIAINQAKIDIDEINNKEKDSALKKEKVLNRQLKLEEELRKIKEDYYSDIGNVMSKYYDKELRLIKNLHDADYKYIQGKELLIKKNDLEIDKLNDRLEEINKQFDKQLEDKALAKSASSAFQSARNQLINGNNGVDLAKLLNTPVSEFERYIEAEKERINAEFDVDQDAQKRAEALKKLALEQNVFFGELSKGITKNTREYDDYTKKANTGFRDYKEATKAALEATRDNIIESENLIDKIEDLSDSNKEAQKGIDEANSKINTDIDNLTSKFKTATGEWVSDINSARAALQGISTDATQAIADLMKVEAGKNNASRNTSLSSYSSYTPANAPKGYLASGEQGPKTQQQAFEETQKNPWGDRLPGESVDDYIARIKKEDAQRFGTYKGFSKGGISTGPKSGYPVMLHGREGIITEEMSDNLAYIIKMANTPPSTYNNVTNSGTYAPNIFVSTEGMSPSQAKEIFRDLLNEQRIQKNISYGY